MAKHLFRVSKSKFQNKVNKMLIDILLENRAVRITQTCLKKKKLNKQR